MGVVKGIWKILYHSTQGGKYVVEEGLTCSDSVINTRIILALFQIPLAYNEEVITKITIFKYISIFRV